MALKRRKTPRIEPAEYSTYWPGDDAIDLGGSDLEQYCRSGGDVSSLKIREGHTPDEIVYRPLTEREILAVGMARHHAPYEAFRYALVSISGMELRRVGYDNGLRGLTQECLDEMSHLDFSMDLPWVLTVDLANKESGGEEKQRKGAPYEPVNIARLIGHFIQVVTFRERK